MRQSSSPLPATYANKVRERFPDHVKSMEDVMAVYAPRQWEYVMVHKDSAYTCKCPTIADIRTLYGQKSAARWIGMQIAAIFVASASRDEGMADSIKLFSESFSVEVSGYKLTELMLFFARFRSGRYDGSYTQFDPKRIGNCFFREFLNERNYELDRIEREQNRRTIEQRRFVSPEGKSSWEAYQEAKRKADSGDEEAKKLLQGPCT